MSRATDRASDRIIGAGRAAAIDRRAAMLALVSCLGFGSAAVGQTRKQARIGFLSPQNPGSLDLNLKSLHAGLADLGYVVGRDIVFEYRYASGDLGRIDGLTAELIAAGVELIITQGAATRHLERVPPPVPVLFVFSGDPVVAGLTGSLARPRATMTGLTFQAAEMVGKQVELLSEIRPGLRGFALLANPEHPGEHVERAQAEAAARRLGLNLVYFATRTPAELETALTALKEMRPDGILVFSDTFALLNRQRLAAFGLAERIPMVGGWEVFAESGFLLTYGARRTDAYRRLASYIDRLLRGASPADLPIEQPTRFELVVNQKTANALSLAIPPAILLRADEVIE